MTVDSCWQVTIFGRCWAAEPRYRPAGRVVALGVLGALGAAEPRGTGGIFMGYTWGIYRVFIGYTYVSGMCRVCIGYVSGIYRKSTEK